MRTLLCALFALAACGFEKLPAVPGAGTDGGNTHGTLTLAATAGDQQQGTAGAALALMIEVTATNDLVPVENLTIDFTATGGGTLSSSSLRTDVNGKAEVALTLGRTAGANIVTASAANVDSLTFTEMGLAGTAAKLAKLSADPSPTVAGSTLAPLVVLVSDANDNTVANTDVTFAVSAGAGSLSATTVTTGADGHASTTFTLDKKAGPNQVDASIVGASRVSFVATGLVGSVSMLIATSGNGVNASAGAAIPVVVTAIDANGNGVTGVAVGFAVTAGGGHLSAATGTTDANGQVTTTITLGTTPGQNTLVASATGLSSLQITNIGVLGNPSKIVLVSPTTSPTATVNTQVAPLVVAIQDAASNPIAGAIVTFAITANTGTITTASGMTDAQGQVQTTLTLATLVGANKVEARAPGLANSPIVFTATGTAGAAARLTLDTGNMQTAEFGAQLPVPIGAMVSDTYGNPVSGRTVTFAATTGGGTVATPSVSSSATGLAQTSVTLGIDSNTFTATSAGLAGSPLTFTETAKSFASVTGPNASAAFVLADINGDGKIDIIESSFGSGVDIYRNTTLSGATTVRFASTSISTNTSGGLVPFAVGDLNGDGIPDIAAVYQANNEILVLANTTAQNTQTISFAPSVHVATSATPNVVLIGDINGDGFGDLIVVKTKSSLVSIYLNTSTVTGSSTPTFAAGIDVAVGSSPTFATIGDLNNDTKPDIVVVNSTATVSVLRNTTTSTPAFVRSDLTTGAQPCAVAIADLNGDGKPDLAVSDKGAGIAIFFNTTVTGLTFAAKIELSTLDPSAIVAGDFDGDGKPDLGVVAGNQVAVFLNRTAVNDTSPTMTGPFDVGFYHSNSGDDAFFFHAADLNGDNKLDFTANTSGTIMNVLLAQ